MVKQALPLGNQPATNDVEVIEVPLRSYRRTMRPRLPRKLTSSARININKFWNELEDFYSRFDNRKFDHHAKKLSITVERVPYTTDVYDHARESAENRLNELLEEQWVESERVEGQDLRGLKMAMPPTHSLPLPPKATPTSARLRLGSYDVVDDETCSMGSTRSSSRCSSPMGIWNAYEDQYPLETEENMPMPPTSLIDLVSLMSKNYF